MGYTLAGWILFWSGWSEVQWAEYCSQRSVGGITYTRAEWLLFFSQFSPRQWWAWLQEWMTSDDDDSAL